MAGPAPKTSRSGWDSNPADTKQNRPQSPSQRMSNTTDETIAQAKNTIQMVDANGALQVDQSPKRSVLDKMKNPNNGSRY